MSKNHHQLVWRGPARPTHSLTFAPSSDGHRPFKLLLPMPANLPQSPSLVLDGLQALQGLRENKKPLKFPLMNLDSPGFIRFPRGPCPSKPSIPSRLSKLSLRSG